MKKWIWFAILAPILIIPAFLLAGFTVQMLWLWFVVPLGLGPISLGHAIGVDMLITFTAHVPALEPPGVDDKTKAKHFFRGLYLRPVVQLGLGWLAHAWMVKP